MDNNPTLVLDKDSFMFLEEHKGLLRKNYSTGSYSNNVRLTFDNLIDVNENQMGPSRFIFTKEGLAHLKLLFTISSNKDINAFYKSIKSESVSCPDIQKHKEIKEVLDKFHLASNIRDIKPYSSFDIESLKCLKQILTDNLKKNYETLMDLIEEYRYYKERIQTQTDQFKRKLKEKFIAKSEAVRARRENKRIDSLRKSLLYRKNKLKYIKKRMDLYIRYFEQDRKEVSSGAGNKTEISPLISAKGKSKYSSLLKLFKDQKIEVDEIEKEISNYSGKGSEVYEKYSAISNGLSFLESRLQADVAYKNSLASEIKTLIVKVEKQKNELKIIKKIIGLCHDFELSMLVNIDHLKWSLNAYDKIYARYKGRKDSNTDFTKTSTFKDFSEKTFLENKKLCEELNVFQQRNQKVLNNIMQLSGILRQGKKRFEKIKSELSSLIPLSRIMLLKKELSQNKTVLSDLKVEFDKLENDFLNAKKEEKKKLSALKELMGNFQMHTSKHQIYIEFSKEKISADENILIDLYNKLTGLAIKLATNYQMFEASGMYNAEFTKAVQDIYTDIEFLRKEILRKFQYGKEFLEKEEGDLYLQIRDQQTILKKYSRFYDKFQKLYLNRDDIENLIYQNSDLEKQLNHFYPKENKKYELGGLAFESFYHVGYFKKGFRNRLDNIFSIENLKLFKKNSREELSKQNDEDMPQRKEPVKESKFLNISLFLLGG